MFILLSMLAACVPQEDYQLLQEENARLLARIGRLDAIVERERQQVIDLRTDLQPLVSQGLLTIEVSNGRITLSLRSDVLFAKGSSDLSADGKDAVQKLAKALGSRAPDRDFQVEGHTDNDPINTAQFPSNWYLGAARGITVTEAMIAGGLPRKHVSAASFSDTHPVADNNNATGQAQNRRIEIVLVPDVSDIYKRLEKGVNKGPKGGRKNRPKKES